MEEEIMREIKFRAWAKTRQEMVYLNPYEISGSARELSDLVSDEGWFVMQSTGLKDKNGKEIYESDLFDAWDGRSKYVVEWLEAHACFKLVWVSGDVGDSKIHHYFDMYMAEYQFEPIGNIYENPELLEATDSQQSTKGSKRTTDMSRAGNEI
jgi:uncharacterized phage protein (TIGR01671 family)